MDETGIPPKIRKAIEEYRKREAARVILREIYGPKPETDGQIRAGDIWLAPHPNGECSRLALVVKVNHDDQVCEVLLMHPYKEYATDTDILIREEESWLPYALVAQLDIRGVLRWRDLGRWVSRVSRDMREFSVDALNAGVPNPCGPKLLGPSDERWQFKREEGREMRALHTPALVQLLGLE